ncbi:MAG: DNA polymerase III subunit beta [Roseiflexaceae bacterium]
MQRALKGALKAVSAAIGKHSLAILQHVLLEVDATAGVLRLAATDLECAMMRTLAGDTGVGACTDSFSVALPAKLLLDVIENLPDGQMTITYHPARSAVTITHGDAFEVVVHGLPAAEFPQLPTPHGERVVISGAHLATAIALTKRCASTDDNRPALKAIRLKAEGQALSFAAADGHRAAFATFPLQQPTTAAMHLPLADALARVVPLFAEQPQVTLMFGQNVLSIEGADATATVRVVDATYPAIDQLFAGAATASTTLVAERDALVRAAKLNKVFATALCFQATDDRLTIGSTPQETGTNRTTIPVTISGPQHPLMLNVAFVLDALDAIAAANVAIMIQSPRAPVVFRPLADPPQPYTYLHLVMPMTSI